MAKMKTAKNIHHKVISKNPLIYTISISKDNEAARRRLRRRISNTLRKPTTQPTKLAKESEMASGIFTPNQDSNACRHH
jgi:hypothetical protein